MKSIILAAVISSAILGSAVVADANAQEFKGTCTELKAETICAASGWCRWSNRKPVTLPTGQVIQPAGFCAFKPGFKAAYQAQPATK